MLHRKHVFLGLTRFLSFSPLQRCMVRVTNNNSARRLLKHVRKNSWWLRKESCVSTGVRKPGNMCVTNHHDMTFINPNRTLPNNKILDSTKLKAFADNKIEVVQMMISVCEQWWDRKTLW